MIRLALCLIAILLPLRAETSAPPPPPPHLVMEQLSRMTPEERDRMFAKLPPRRRQAIEQRLEKYSQLPPAVKARLREEYDRFEQLAPEKQEEVRRLFRDFSQLPEDRRRALRRELNRLRRAGTRRAAVRWKSERFRVEFSEPERQMLEQLLTLLPR